jgi:hypothetical protein
MSYSGYSPSGRSGVRLVDVLIGACILVLLAGLALPWLSQNQLGHRPRSEGSNRLKNIALAIHSYNDAFDGKLPPLTDVGEHAPNNAGLNSLLFNILPYLEYDNVFRIFYSKTTPNYTNTLTSGYGPPPGGAAVNVIKAFIDPADQTGGAGTTTSLSITLAWKPPAPFLKSFVGTYATTSYAANALIFGSNDAGLPRTFKDGTSNTIMIAQRPQICDPLDGTRPVYNLWAFGYYGPQTPAFALLTPDIPTGMTSTNQVAPELPLPKEWSADKMSVRIGRASSQPTVPDFTTPFQQVVRGRACDPRRLGTPHASGMLVALGDGSVRSVAPNISPWTFWAACTPDGNETLYTEW